MSSLLGMGTWGMGGKYERDESTVPASLEVLAFGLSLGITTIDTAEMYGAGLTEEIVGKAIQGHPREQVRIISKVWHTHMKYDDVLHAAEASLKRLDTSYIDLYLIHWPNEEVPIAETARAMERLRTEGIVKAIGLSNFNATQMEEASAALSGNAWSANEFEYSLMHQEAARDIIPYCTAHAMEMIAYRPLAKGRLSDTTLPRLDALAQKYGKTRNQVALNWIMAQGMLAIPATLNLEHLRENADARSFTLAPEDVGVLTDRP